MLAIAAFCLLVSSTFGAAVKDGMMKTMMPNMGMMTTGKDGMMGTMMPGAPDMKMCCMPPQWEGDIVDLNPPGQQLYGLRYAHDDASMREGFYLTMVGSTKPIMQVFKDFMDKTIYTVNMTSSNPMDFTCKQTKNVDHFFSSCIDKDHIVSDLHYIGDATLGPMNGSNIHYDGWSFKIGTDMDVVLSLSRDGCVPVMESVKTPLGQSILMFNNMSPMVMTKDLLTIPAACASSGAAVVG